MGAWIVGLAAVVAVGQAEPPVGRDGGVVAECLERVRDYHGGAGPWAVVGYRMGRRALAELGLPRSSHNLDVVHHCPEQVQFACVMDGVHAATGASSGKLNLRHVVCGRDEMRTVFTNRVTGRSMVVRVRPELAGSILDLPPERREAEGARVAALADEAVFTIEPLEAAGGSR
jgi:formylmethanofuran dehydrogenase subunit E